jgi:2-methylisocitrate lyase-like PEP mutase family enzyme
MANLIENGKTPLLPVRHLEEMGYQIAVYALTLLNASIASIQQALASIRQGETVPGLMDFKTLRQIVGFDAYDAALDQYHGQK